MSSCLCRMVILCLTVSALCYITCGKEKFIPNEKDSGNYICKIQGEEYDYYLQHKDIGHVYRRDGHREASVGTTMDGMYYDGENAYQYPGGKRIATFPFEEYDLYVDRLLKISQQIITDKLYESYNDYSKEWIRTNYYFKITKEGLALFGDDPAFCSGLIVCYYRDQQFYYFKLLLFGDNKPQATLSCDIGHIDYSAFISPP